MVNINIEVPEDTHKKIKILAAANGMSLKELIIQSLEESTNERKR